MQANPKCATCQGSGVILQPPLSIPSACPSCTADMVASLPPLEEGDEMATPAMQALAELVIVQRPEAAISGIPEGRAAISVGGGTVAGNGVLHLSVHHPDGEVLVATLGPAGLMRLSAMINTTARQLQAGMFDLKPGFPGTPQ